ncbi:MAG TPA: helix-turn-helix transcriptional regulator, partial [Kamptonema sp.]|nr:helix-turn-helix transcriptional regulator [Kamptonema sp.]
LLPEIEKALIQWFDPCLNRTCRKIQSLPKKGSMKNLIKPFLDERSITPYRFWQTTKISRVTAYRLYNDPTYIPGADVLTNICDTYKIQPGVVLLWTPEEGSKENNEAKETITTHLSGDTPPKKKQTKMGRAKGQIVHFPSHKAS